MLMHAQERDSVDCENYRNVALSTLVKCWLLTIMLMEMLKAQTD